MLKNIGNYISSPRWSLSEEKLIVAVSATIMPFLPGKL